MFSGDVAYVWHGALHGDVVGGDLTACGFELRAQIVWAKPHFNQSELAHGSTAIGLDKIAAALG